MAVRWVVDAMNVLGARPDGWWRDRKGAMRALVERLDAFAGCHDDSVTVVLDAPLDPAPALEHARLVVASRRGRDAADDEIARLVESDEDPASLCVVTSDGELARRVTARGAGVTGAGGFRARLDDT